MEQTITPPENSTFSQGIGDWITNGEWTPNMGLGNSPGILFSWGLEIGQRYMILGPPHVSLIPGKTHTFRFFALGAPVGGALTITWQLTAEEYSFQGSQTLGEEPWQIEMGGVITIPEDSDPIPAQISIYLDGTENLPAQTVISNVSITYPEIQKQPIQYLTLVGVG